MAEPDQRYRNRLTLGVGAVVTLAEAAALLPMADREARAWLRARSLVRNLDGRPVIRWIDVLDALAGDHPEPSAPNVPARRVKLPPI